MDSLITAAARALAAGDLLGALKRVALRDDAPALAVRDAARATLEAHGDRVNAAYARYLEVRRLHTEAARAALVRAPSRLLGTDVFPGRGWSSKPRFDSAVASRA